ncbi:NAD(P)-binding protein [Rhizoclosmatium globosum]|uniref:NAD(P)-binding protein n=1 Tax=Rhizoclosmatium globosum TaxID=329046 RepID=A0A1Y2BP42_9FUNG|nr:NAD(P)-binding protein [Rhizoclosmatium globosum]|eukprot:ORY36520.1 NAD(P)-binding protein [Rhizoclosmatium globosum]
MSPSDLKRKSDSAAAPALSVPAPTKAAPAGPCRTVLASEVCTSFVNDLKKAVAAKEKAPLLVAFLANEDPAAKKYAEWTGKTCEEAGFRFDLRVVQKQELDDKLFEANNDPSVNGIMIYYPIFGGTQDAYLQNSVSIKKDVEGLCHTYRYNMYRNIRFLDEQERFKCIVPCTPLAVIKILEHIGVYNRILNEGNRLYGQTITVVNRSEVVGRPLAALLANDGAKVYSADENGLIEFHRGDGLKLKKHEVFETNVTLTEALRASDVVITGVPTDKFKVDTNLLKDGVIAVNFSTAKNFKDDIKQKASIFVPSVGKVTVAMLLRNLLRLEEYQNLNVV